MSRRPPSRPRVGLKVTLISTASSSPAICRRSAPQNSNEPHPPLKSGEVGSAAAKKIRALHRERKKGSGLNGKSAPTARVGAPRSNSHWAVMLGAFTCVTAEHRQCSASLSAYCRLGCRDFRLHGVEVEARTLLH